MADLIAYVRSTSLYDYYINSIGTLTAVTRTKALNSLTSLDTAKSLAKEVSNGSV